jgi:thioredoxin-related protein
MRTGIMPRFESITERKMYSYRTWVTRSFVAVSFFMLAGTAVAQSELGYEPEADPFEQIANASLIAGRDDKKLLVIAGGDWCIWCHYLDAFLKHRPDVDRELKSTFVIVKAYLGDDNFNEAFFATLPEAAGYPHFWVLDVNGELLASQNTLPLEDGDKSYDVAMFLAFIRKWQ